MRAMCHVYYQVRDGRDGTFESMMIAFTEELFFQGVAYIPVHLVSTPQCAGRVACCVCVCVCVLGVLVGVGGVCGESWKEGKRSTAFWH